MTKRRADPAPDTQPIPYPYIAEDLRTLATAIGDVSEDPGNAKIHDAAAVAAQAASLRAYGQRKPIVANRRTGRIEAGHGIKAAALSLGWKWLAVVWVDDDPNTAAGFALADNRTAELSEWNPAAVEALIAELSAPDPELEAIFAGLAEELAPAEPRSLKPITIAAPPAMSWTLIGIPVVRFGEIAETLERVAAIPGILVETTANDEGAE